MLQEPLLETMLKYMHELNYDLPEMAIQVVQAKMTHSYHIQKTLRRELGPKKGLEFYAAMIAKKNRASMVAKAAESLGIKEVEDIPTMGKIVERALTNFPLLYEIVRNDADAHVGHVLWCVNPTYGACDNYLERQAYFRNERDITKTPCLTGFVEYAKMHGLKEDIEVDVIQSRCVNADARFCEYVLKKKGTPEIKPTIMPVEEESFIEFEMGDEEPLFYILKKQGRTLEEQIPSSFLAFFMYDSSAYDAFEEKLGEGKATELYNRLWLTYPAAWTEEARLELEIGKARSLEELARIIAFCEKKRFTTYQATPQGERQVILTSVNDPFLDMATKFMDKEIDDSYLKAVASANQEFIIQVVRETKMSDVAKVTVKKATVRGDDHNEIVIEWR